MAAALVAVVGAKPAARAQGSQLPPNDLGLQLPTNTAEQALGLVYGQTPIGSRNIGRVRVGYTRARLRRLPVRAPRRTRRSYRFCVKRSSGAVIAVFDRRGRVRFSAVAERRLLGRPRALRQALRRGGL